MVSTLFISPLFSSVKVFPIDQSPYNDSAVVQIVESKDRVVKSSDTLFLKITSFPIGVVTKYEPMENAGIKQIKDGSEILVIFGGKASFRVKYKDVQNYQQKQAYFTRQAKIQIPSWVTKSAEKGEIPIIAVPINSYGESIKSRASIATAVMTHIVAQHRKDDVEMALKEEPLLFYNMPEDGMVYSSKETILLDFIILNAHLSEHGNHVELRINEKPVELSKWAPYGIQGLPKGEHTIEIRLLNNRKKIIENPFGAQKATITVK